MDFFKNLFKRKTPKIIEKTKLFDEIYSDLGMFEYTELGFKFKSKDFQKSINWSDIDQINTYKKDVVIYDLAVIDIISEGHVLTINEESPGWFQLVLKLKEVFQEIPKDWDINIMQPAFEENFTIIYKKP